MFTHSLQPRFCETDALGHIGNTALPVWFQEARWELIRIFNPDMRLSRWNLILKKFEIEIHRQIRFVDPVRIDTGVEKIGRSSLILHQRAHQKKRPVATGRTVLVHFDYAAGRPVAIPEAIRRELASHVMPDAPPSQPVNR